MPILDRRADQLSSLTARLQTNLTFADYLQVQYERRELQLGLQKAREEFSHLGRGWVFRDPRKSPA